MNKEYSKSYKTSRDCVNQLLDDQQEYFKIVSEFKDNETIRQIYELTLNEEASKHLMLRNSIYVLTLRKMANIINGLRGKLQLPNNKVEDYYKSRCGELERELQKTKADLEAISKIINRGEKIE